VSHNTRQGLIVILIFFGPILLFLLLTATHSAQAKREAALESVRSSLTRSYAEAFVNQTNDTSGTNRVVESQELLAAFCNTNTCQLKTTGFVWSTNIWISSQPVRIGTTNLCCVAGVFDDQRYGIDAVGNFRVVGESEFARWPCLPACQLIDSDKRIR
jgi:hypothetical protein